MEAIGWWKTWGKRGWERECVFRNESLFGLEAGWCFSRPKLFFQFLLLTCLLYFYLVLLPALWRILSLMLTLLDFRIFDYFRRWLWRYCLIAAPSSHGLQLCRNASAAKRWDCVTRWDEIYYCFSCRGIGSMIGNSRNFPNLELFYKCWSLKEYFRYVLPTAYASIHDKEEQDARSSFHHLGEAGGNPSFLTPQYSCVTACCPFTRVFSYYSCFTTWIAKVWLFSTGDLYDYKFCLTLLYFGARARYGVPSMFSAEMISAGFVALTRPRKA